LKSALFVDFDNIYSGLRKLDQATADRFARRPTEWVSWMVNSLALPEHVTENGKRRILVRRCYLNPQMYQDFRPFFNLAGFEITDCPALTSGGKTSTDIHMVLDIVELLQHEAHYDEFIVLSADADFTPVLRKLRRWDRRTTILAIGFPSAAYRASADLVIDQQEFVSGALGMAKQHEVVVPKAEVASVSLDALRALVQAEVQQSPEPVACARLAVLIARHVGATPSDWYGSGTFKRFLETMELAPLQFDWKEAGGVVFDPQRHTRSVTAPPPPEQEWAGDKNMLALARQLHELAGIPLLPPERYRALFRMLSADLAEHGYTFLDTAKRVRDRCCNGGYPISRADIDFVLRGLVFRGHNFEEHSSEPEELGAKFLNNVRSLYLREQMVLTTATEATLRKWIAAAQ
jgi:hypothetical protein